MSQLKYVKTLSSNRVTCRLDENTQILFLELCNEWLVSPQDAMRRCIVETHKHYKKELTNAPV